VLNSFLQPIGIVAYSLDKQVDPFLGCEGFAFLDVVVQREPDDLKGGKLGDAKRILSSP
jgi:hypothetical protein